MGPPTLPPNCCNTSTGRGMPLALSTASFAPVPELRKVHGMSNWVHDQLGPHATQQSGDDTLRNSFMLTKPWGLE